MSILIKNHGHARSLAKRYKPLRDAAIADGRSVYDVPYVCQVQHVGRRITHTGECEGCAAIETEITRAIDNSEGVTVAYATLRGWKRAPISLEERVSYSGVCKANDKAVAEFCAANDADPLNWPEMLSKGFTSCDVPHNGLWRFARNGNSIKCTSCESMVKTIARRRVQNRIAATGVEEWEG